jgi:hypothetical protein
LKQIRVGKGLDGLHEINVRPVLTEMDQAILHEINDYHHKQITGLASGLILRATAEAIAARKPLELVRGEQGVGTKACLIYDFVEK